MRKKYSYHKKITDERAKYTVHCKCSHAIVFYPFEHKAKKVCSWCGRTVYENDLEKFKDKLLKKRKEVK